MRASSTGPPGALPPRGPGRRGHRAPIASTASGRVDHGASARGARPVSCSVRARMPAPLRSTGAGARDLHARRAARALRWRAASSRTRARRDDASPHDTPRPAPKAIPIPDPSRGPWPRGAPHVLLPTLRHRRGPLDQVPFDAATGCARTASPRSRPPSPSPRARASRPSTLHRRGPAPRRHRRRADARRRRETAGRSTSLRVDLRAS